MGRGAHRIYNSCKYYTTKASGLQGFFNPPSKILSFDRITGPRYHRWNQHAYIKTTEQGSMITSSASKLHSPIPTNASLRARKSTALAGVGV